MTETLPPSTDRAGAALDKLEIGELVDRYVVTLDTAADPGRGPDWYRSLFTEDVALTFPIREHHGLDGLAEFHRAARLTWQTTTHLSGNHVVELEGDVAEVRVNVIGTHVEWGVSCDRVGPEHRFDMGGHYEATAVRTAQGWRIARLHFAVAWTAGDGTPRGEAM